MIARDCLSDEHSELFDELDRLIIEIYIKRTVICMYIDENDDVRVIGDKSDLYQEVIELGREDLGGWRARVIRFLRGDYLEDDYYSYERQKKRNPWAFDD